MTNPRKNTMNSKSESQESAFELEENDSTVPEAKIHKIEKNQASIKPKQAVFGLDDTIEDGEKQFIATPSELTDEKVGDATESPSYKIAVAAINNTANGSAVISGEIPLVVDLNEAKQIVETLLFASHESLRPRDISMVFRGVENVNAKVVRKLLSELVEEYKDRTLQIVEVAEGFRMCTRLEQSPWVRRFLKAERKWRVSNAGLETLAIIAYKQPLTKVEVEEIRRVDCGGVLHTLLERKMIRILGRRDVVGKPIVYGTTPQFLEHFGFKTLTDMPKPDEFEMEINLGEQGHGGDIIPIETDFEPRDNDTDLAEESSHLHANGAANGQTNGSANSHITENQEEDSINHTTRANEENL